jgi:peptidoglycan/xylan/chitin deacetylase (PgdA/CDA1 family)
MRVTALALTFDDGPDPVWTPRVLDALDACGARATFFPIAPRAARHPALVARILAAGHIVGLHCDEHVRHTERDEAWLRRDTAAALARLAALGVRPRLWRTPWGSAAPWTPRVAALHGLRLVPWSADTHDWRGDDAPAMLERIRGGLVAGAIVLAHDGLGPGALRDGCEQTVALIPSIAALAAERGLRLTTLEVDERIGAAA